MARRKIRAWAVRREQVDIDKVVAGLLQLIKDEAAAKPSTDDQEPAA